MNPDADRPSITAAFSPSDRTWPLLAGLVQLPGPVALHPLAAPSIEELFQRQMDEVAYDVAELSLASYLIAFARGDRRQTAIPAFLSRSFRHSSLFVRRDSPLRTPEHLRGVRFGLPEYQMTAAVWVRALLRHDFGIPSEAVHWVTYRPERVTVAVPVERGQAPNIFQGLLEGEVDVIMTARRPPERFFGPAGDGPLRRLFDDAFARERAYFRAGGVFPVMHLVAVRQATAERWPHLPRALYDVLAEVKRQAVAATRETIALASANPFAVEAAELAAAVQGPDPWPYGLSAELPHLTRFVDYLVEDGLLERAVPVRDAFHPSTWDT